MTNDKQKLQISNTIKDSIKDLLIGLLIKYPKIKREWIIKEIYNNAYFLNRYEGEIFKQ
jgi:hypothetical protein